jgi:hypothetical protein
VTVSRIQHRRPSSSPKRPLWAIRGHHGRTPPPQIRPLSTGVRVCMEGGHGHEGWGGRGGVCFCALSRGAFSFQASSSRRGASALLCAEVGYVVKTYVHAKGGSIDRNRIKIQVSVEQHGWGRRIAMRISIGFQSIGVVVEVWHGGARFQELELLGCRPSRQGRRSWAIAGGGDLKLRSRVHGGSMGRYIMMMKMKLKLKSSS